MEKLWIVMLHTGAHVCAEIHPEREKQLPKRVEDGERKNAKTPGRRGATRTELDDEPSRPNPT